MSYSFQLGDLVLPCNIIYSPLAGCSDYPFRQMVRQYFKGLIFCEMVKMDALVRNDKNTFHFLFYDNLMHPIGAQICGSKPFLAGPSARIIEDLGFDVIDFNCGCPVAKVVKDGSGAGMLKTPELIGEIVSEMVNAVKIPVTVKIRIGWDEDTVNACEVVSIVEKAGASAVFVHGRTRKQGYKGEPNLSCIKECKDIANIKIIGNGSVFDIASAKKMFEITKCDGILVSRGILGKPWLGSEILEGLTSNVNDSLRAFEQHFKYVIDYYPEKRAVLDARRIGCWYSRYLPGAREFRSAITKAVDIEQVWLLIKNLGERIRTSDHLHPMQVR